MVLKHFFFTFTVDWHTDSTERKQRLYSYLMSKMKLHIPHIDLFLKKHVRILAINIYQKSSMSMAYVLFVYINESLIN